MHVLRRDCLILFAIRGLQTDKIVLRLPTRHRGVIARIHQALDSFPPCLAAQTGVYGRRPSHHTAKSLNAGTRRTTRGTGIFLAGCISSAERPVLDQLLRGCVRSAFEQMSIPNRTLMNGNLLGRRAGASDAGKARKRTGSRGRGSRACAVTARASPSMTNSSTLALHRPQQQAACGMAPHPRQPPPRSAAPADGFHPRGA